MPGRLATGLRDHAPGVRRGRRRLAEGVLASGRRLRVQGSPERLLGRELRPSRAAERAEHPAHPGRRRRGQVLLRPQEPLGHRQQGLRDRGRAGKLPVGARLRGRLGSQLSPVVAPGCRRGRHLHVRDERAAAGLLRDQGGDQRGLGRELRRGRRSRRSEHPVHRPVRQREGHLHVRRRDARAHGLRCGRPRRPGRPRSAVALRPGAEGLPGHRAQPILEGLVHGCERRPQRRLLPDDRQHERRDAPVRRHRRLDLHGPADAGHDVQRGGSARSGGAGLQDHGTGEERQVPDRDRVHHRPEPQRRPDARRVQARRSLATGSTSASTRP